MLTNDIGQSIEQPKRRDITTSTQQRTMGVDWRLGNPRFLSLLTFLKYRIDQSLKVSVPFSVGREMKTGLLFLLLFVVISSPSHLKELPPHILLFPSHNETETPTLHISKIPYLQTDKIRWNHWKNGGLIFALNMFHRDSPLVQSRHSP